MRNAPAGTGIQIYSTAAVPAPRRAAYWNTIYEQFTELDIAPTRPDGFDAELRLGRVGALQIALVRSDGARVERTRRHAARARERQLGILVILSGEGVWSHSGQEGTLSAGDVVICDNTRPMSCRYGGPVSGVTLRPNEAVLRSRLPFVDDLCGARLPGNAGLTRAVAAIAGCLAEQAAAVRPTEYSLAMANHFVDVLATSCAMARGGAAPVDALMPARRAVVRQFVEAHLASPDLTPRLVAEAAGISPRYLRLLMAEEGERVSALILRRRLEECARQLASPLWRERTITDIAFSWGFNSTAHFARVFKQRFGLAPSDYRRAAMEMDQALPA